MRLTTKSEYAILALIYILRHQKDGFVKIERICRQYGISKKYLEQLFLVFRQKGFLQTKRGANGGYQLTATGEKLTLAQVIRIMDGYLAPTESVSKYFFARTPLSREKSLLKPFKEIRDYIAERLERIKLADLA